MEEKLVQEYIIHLMDGTKIITTEDYELPIEKSIVTMFDKANAEDVLQICDFLIAHYIPKRSILYISSGDVYEAEFDHVFDD